ncbi:MAG: DUF389 domain-containing protein [Dermatophilaceae bacterium]
MVVAASADRLDVIRERVWADAGITPAYLVMNAAATVIAGLGLFQNSPAVIIGAMLIATLMSPIQGVALALAEADGPGLGRALRSELFGVLWVFGVGALVGLAFRDLPIGSEILGRSQPTILDLGVAFFGGLAGGYALVSRQVSSAVVGVAIATALVPPLTASALLAVRGLTGPALGCFLNFATNFTAIALSQMLVLLLAGFRPPLRDHGAYLGTAAARIVLLALLVVLAWHLVDTYRRTFGVEVLRLSLIDRARQELAGVTGARVLSLQLEQGEERPLVRLVVRAPHPITPERTAVIESALTQTAGRGVELHVRTVLTMESVSGGWVTEPDDILPSESN